MPKDIDKQLDDILDISQDIKKKSTEVVKVPERTEHAETDYRYARENLYNLVERGQDAIDGILDLSKEILNSKINLCKSKSTDKTFCH